MRTLIVAAPPSPAALTTHLTHVAARQLEASGHEVTTLDLRELDWDPVVRPADYGRTRFTGPVGPASAEALASGALDPQVRRHQQLLTEADLLVLLFPLWWHGMPALLKGWVDRVFTQGFAYGLHDETGQPRKYGDGAFRGTRGLVVTTVGDRATAFGPRGVNGRIEDLLFPITHGILWYTGIAALRPLVVPDVNTPAWPGAADAERRLRERLAGLADERPMPYRELLADYDASRVLHPDRAPGRTDLAVHCADG